MQRQTGTCYLFNALAWAKAKCILKEIICGYYSDPPSEILYRYELSSNGEVNVDKNAIPFFRCSRDTNALEGEYAIIDKTIGNRSIRIEFFDHVLAERRHRSIINA